MGPIERRWSDALPTADGDVAVLPADVRVDGVAPRSGVDTARIAARVAVQHGRDARRERVTVRVLLRPALAPHPALGHVHASTVVAPVSLVTVH